MISKYRTQGFVFKKDTRAESDQTFAVFTKDFGRLELRAKAIKKITSKLRKDFDIFYFSEIEFIQGRSYKTLTDANKIKKINAGENLNKLSVLCRISDVLDMFIKGQEKDDATFDLLVEFLGKLGDASELLKNHQLVFYYFFWNFISLQGYKIEVDNCAGCRSKLNPENLYFSSKMGGIICSKCLSADSGAKKINSDIVKILRIIFKKDWDIISKLKVEPYSQNLMEDISQNAIRAFCPEHC